MNEWRRISKVTFKISSKIYYGRNKEIMGRCNALLHTFRFGAHIYHINQNEGLLQLFEIGICFLHPRIALEYIVFH